MIVTVPNATLAPLLKTLGYKFKNLELLEGALTHPSLSGGRQARAITAYERLEFLGDRVVGLVIAAWLYELYPDATEGELAKRHTGLVNREVLTLVAEQLELFRYLQVAKSEKTAGAVNNAIMSDACEAVIGALYLDGGLAAAEQLIRRAWQPMLQEGEGPPVDPKTALQEWAQARGLPLPAYHVVQSDGPAHAPRFVVEVVVQGQSTVSAEGPSKRAAEKIAAALLLEKIK
jgi:ribonuclease III